VAIDWEGELNPAQRQAVVCPGGPLLILAGAGSGKTRVITFRIAHLLGVLGVRPHEIFAVTFTNKAAGEMVRRVEQLVGGRSGGMWVSTFHSACARLLRRFGDRVGLNRDYVIYDDADQRALVTRIVRDLGLAERMFPARDILSRIDGAKNAGVGPEDFRASDFLSDAVARVYPIYQRRLRESNACDFGDLLLHVVRLLERDAPLRAELAGRFRHVLVDEFQDTNQVQYRLVQRLASVHRNLCVVGDDDQSIYGWRGADVRNILDFQRDYCDAQVIKLERNYRSTSIILGAANAVIARNSRRLGKTLYTEVEGGEPLLLYEADSERDEARFVARAIRKLIQDDGFSPEDFAVFYRMGAQSRAIEEALREARVEYVVVGGVRFYDRAEIKDVIAYLRFLVNPLDETSLLRIVNVPARGIGDTTVERVVGQARRLGVPLVDAFRVAAREEDLVGAAARRKIVGFLELCDGLREESPHLSPAALVERVLERTGYLERLAVEGTTEAEARAGNLMELVGDIREYERSADAPTLGEYLERISLVSDADTEIAGGRVSLMTVHAAKGLEFPVVLLTGLEESVFPLLRGGDSPSDLDEERRLAYVAITRARRRLFLSYARSRRLYGNEQINPPSRFIGEIPEELIVVPVAPVRRAPAVVPTPRPFVEYDAVPEYDYDQSSPDPEEGPFRVGQRVRHGSFGEGEVRGWSGHGSNLKVMVYFREAGLKTIVARFVEPL
jgi:DNA helicase-2/ATP-dependent DNA helicase PcrA